MLVGVVGGMGPEASNMFCNKLIKAKKCVEDQDNIPFIHYSNPKIPDRTQFILSKGEDPFPELLESCKKVQSFGANFLIMPCNTAHYFLPQIKEEIDVPVVDMVSLTVKKVKEDFPSIQKIGLLSTSGTIAAKVFENKFELFGIETIKPDSFYQDSLVMEAIYGSKGIKSGKKKLAKELLKSALEHLISKGAQVIILGCTEIPLVLKQKDFIIPLYDPMDVTIKKIIEFVEYLENNLGIQALIDKEVVAE